MDRPATALDSFLTPPRILVPKLVRGRDAWKSKASRRKRRLKAALVKIRDLLASRLAWKERHGRERRRAGQAEVRLLAVQDRLAAARAEIARLRDDAPGKTPSS